MNDLEQTLAKAKAVRDAHWGRTVTYSRKVFVPLVTMCRDVCGYCTYARPPKESGARYLSPDEVLAIARRGAELGCKEALFSLGERPEAVHAKAREQLSGLGFDSTHDYLVHCCGLVLRETGLLPHANPGTLGRSELLQLQPVTASMGMMLESTSERLTAKGGPHYKCPDKTPQRRLLTLRTAGELGVPFTTGLLIGIGETWDERIATLQAIADLHAEYGHIQEVIVQNFRAKADILMRHHPEPALDDMLATLAAARLLLPPQISLQAPPNLMADHGRYLDAGINDWGGVSPLTADHINPEAAWPAVDALAATTAEHGCTLTERLAVYPEHFDRVHPAVRPRLEALLG